MTLVNLIRGLKVARPIGMINVHPLPGGLPAGLDRLHLMRRNLTVCKRNLVGFQETEMVEILKGGTGEVIYHDTDALGTNRGAGWRAPDWTIPYSSGFTWLSVAVYDLVSDNVSQIGSSDYISPGNKGVALSFRSGGVQMMAQSAGQTRSATCSVPSIPTIPMMGFGCYDPAGNLKAYVPHLDKQGVLSFGVETHEANPNAGVDINTSSGSFATETNGPVSLLAQWSRMLSNAEMLQAYAALKPWLAERGVIVA